MTINERIKEVRKEVHLTQQAFAEKINLKRNTVASYEIGVLEPSDRTISDICREFQINETWLRSGEGDMKTQEMLDDSERMVNLMRGANENKKKLIRIIADMPDELLDEMLTYLRKVVK